VLQARVDNALAIGHGFDSTVDVFFDNSPVFRITQPGGAVRPIAWFDSATPLRSGWAWGEHYLKDGVVMAEADVGPGKLYLLGPEVLFRAQPHGTFRFVFNGLYAPTGTAARIQ
jgi:hypothetical protein